MYILSQLLGCMQGAISSLLDRLVSDILSEPKMQDFHLHFYIFIYQLGSTIVQENGRSMNKLVGNLPADGNGKQQLTHDR